MFRSKFIIVTALVVVAIAIMTTVGAYFKSISVEGQVFARVNGQPIYLSDLEIAKESLPDEYKNTPIETIFPMIVEIVINQKLSSIAAKKERLDASPEFNRLVNYQKDVLLSNMAMNRYVNARLTNERIQNEYDRISVDMPNVQEWHVLQIYSKTKKDADMIIEGLKKGKSAEDFISGAMIPNSKINETQSGDLGYLRKNNMPLNMVSNVLNLTSGKYSSPVSVDGGYMIYYIKDIKLVKEYSMADIINQLRSSLENDYKVEYYKELTKNSEIEYFDLNGLKVSSPQDLYAR